MGVSFLSFPRRRESIFLRLLFEIFVKVKVLKSKNKKMIDLNWIIEEENNLTYRAKLDLGDNYQLTLDLLKQLQGIKSFSIHNEVAHFFETQIIKDFHLAALNLIRRHSIEANFGIRHALESLSLFVYFMEHKSEKEYVFERDENHIIDFDHKLLGKAFSHIEKRYPLFSKEIEMYRSSINALYSHSNIFSSQYNTAIIDGRIKFLLFDSYYDKFIWEYLCILNEIICLTLEVYKKLFEDYHPFEFEDWFGKELEECFMRQDKLKSDMISELSRENRKGFPVLEEVINKINEKYSQA